MKATITKINSPYEYMNSFVEVRIKGGKIGHLYLSYDDDFYKNAKVGDVVLVDRQVNNPYLVIRR